jgi:DNA-binding transcriptional MocR family regulator
MARDSSNAEIAAAISAVGRQTLNDRVYRELKKSIMSGAFKPGSELKLRSVAEALGTSLMPVRDAMRRLMAERALEMRPSRTIAIPVLSADQFLEIRAIRLLLEGEAVTRAANIAKYVPDGDIRDSNYVNSYDNGMVLEHVLKAAGKDLSRENILRQALSIKDLGLPMLLPGIKVNTGESNHLPVEQLQFMRFTGKQWERFGEVLSTK